MPRSPAFSALFRRGAALAGSVLGSAAWLLAGAKPAHASDRAFTYAYQTQVLAPGQAELEPWVTYRTGRQGYFNRYDLRLEYEVGLLRNFQASLYWNAYSVAEDVVDPLSSAKTRQERFAFQGVSIELKYKLLDSVADPFGFGVYGEGTFGPSFSEYEGKLLFDKDLGRLVLALNLVSEYELSYVRRADQERTLKQLELAGIVGAGYRVSDDVTLGVEARSYTELASGEDPGTSWSTRTSVIHAGPTLAYRQQNWWCASTFFAQVAAPEGATSGHGLDLTNQERYQVRLLMGFHL